jgi:hypothetical protein
VGIEGKEVLKRLFEIAKAITMVFVAASAE